MWDVEHKTEVQWGAVRSSVEHKIVDCGLWIVEHKTVVLWCRKLWQLIIDSWLMTVGWSHSYFPIPTVKFQFFPATAPKFLGSSTLGALLKAPKFLRFYMSFSHDSWYPSVTFHLWPHSKAAKKVPYLGHLGHLLVMCPILGHPDWILEHLTF